MSFHHLDQFARVDSPITRRSPTVRVLGTVIIALGAALLPLGAWAQMAALGALVAVLAALARVPPKDFLVRLAPPLGFVVLVSAGVLVLVPGEPIARAGPLTITAEGALRFGSAIGRGAVAIGAAVVLVSTTRFDDLVEALRTLRLPRVVTTSLALAYRYLYVLNDEVERIRRAAASRNAAAGDAPRRRLWIGITAAALERSFARSERVHQVMLSRGYTGAMPRLRPGAGTGHPTAELLALAALVSAIAASALL